MTEKDNNSQRLEHYDDIKKGKKVEVTMRCNLCGFYGTVMCMIGECPPCPRCGR